MRKKEIPVLMYHQFKDKKDDTVKIKSFVTAKEFERQLKILKFLGYETITFRDLEKIGLENRDRRKYIILTVDDGYKDNYEIMFPLLKKYNMKAVIFLVSDLKYNKWDVEKYGEEKLHLMDENEVREMISSGLIEFGGHTCNHCDFFDVGIEEAKKEIFDNKTALENKYNIKLTTFAYPYGHLNEDVKSLVKEAGYKFAVSTNTGSGNIDDDRYEIRRSGIDRTSLFDFLRKISYRYSIYKGQKWLKKTK
ncbi:hypothetical protein IX317_000961 [Fusobacterium sp. DD29]|uniref:polysaccharide deacetylase family protein n=1 Tax=unclassified Fusobacterium TaxID=2648384 RepID=UPI001B8CC2FA|nr:MULTISPECIES: polysaccharide deacetylase family protein [unclassified Fusobacterium]MBR8749296.1 hypothetical protein [Fusobacterium sp. DD29]MBR8761562.1 hypothetical protein [Fusobacterium sp. DD25]MBR8767569.1 hypothetical protein [Fusobacterium sp. DD43]MBR8771619.1 hypothetical protein [Fusobacterium sp. DD40]MBR8775845.1 hypothetical protein [Fusobacterium sp. DD17]